MARRTKVRGGFPGRDVIVNVRDTERIDGRAAHADAQQAEEEEGQDGGRRPVDHRLLTVA